MSLLFAFIPFSKLMAKVSIATQKPKAKSNPSSGKAEILSLQLLEVMNF